MKITRHSILLVLCVFIFGLKLNAQDKDIKITGNYVNISLAEFITDLEGKYGLHFFYQTKSIRDKQLTLNFNEAALDDCLKQVCTPLFLNYYRKGKSVFLYRGNPIQEDFQQEIVVATEAVQEVSEKERDVEALRLKEFRIVNIGVPGRSSAKKLNLRGRLTAFDDKSPIANGNVIVAGTTKGVSTDKNGYFEIELEKGNHTLQFSSVGRKPTQRIVNVYSNGRIDVELETKITLIGDVDVFGDKKEKVSEVRSGVERISEELINSIPALMGEPDIMKTTLMIPGVQTVGESTQGFNVRGGKTDQNLILVDGAPLYYPSHFFGNFSAVNSDMVKEAILYKGSMPAKYGGRISSVYEINIKDGSNQKIGGKGGISPLSAKIAVDGPVHKLSTFAISARSTYSDYVLDLIKVPELYNSEVSFNDIHAKLNLHLSDKDILKLGYYTSNDKYKLRSDTLYKYKNEIATVNYHHRFTNAWSSQVLLSSSRFAYDISSSKPVSAYQMTHNVHDLGIKNVNEYDMTMDTKLSFGFDFNWYNVNPGLMEAPSGSLVIPFESDREKAGQYGVFAGIEMPISSRLKMEAGIRLAGYFALDNGSRYVYADDKPLDVENIVDTITGEKGQIKQSYFNPEFRLAANYMLRTNSSLKFSYNRTAQYIHILTNSTAISPTDTWKLSDEYIPPQLGHQFSLGYFKSFNANDYETSIEGFYKRIENLKEYKPGATLLLNDHVETEILNGLGKSYGVEFALKKNNGRLNGWLSYSYMRTLIKSTSEFESEQVNGGDYFPASYDKPHNLNLLVNVKASRRVLLSSTINYSTGRPITYPIAKYQLGEQVILHYSDFNQYRIPDYFRMDVSVTFEGNLKANKKIDSSLTFAVYNITGRKNAYSVFYRSEGEKIAGYKLSVFASAIPTISYNFKF